MLTRIAHLKIFFRKHPATLVMPGYAGFGLHFKSFVIGCRHMLATQRRLTPSGPLVMQLPEPPTLQVEPLL